MDPNSLFLHFPKKKTCLCVSRRQSRFLPSMFIDPFGGNVYFTVPPYKRTKIQAPCGEFRVITQRTKRRRGKQRRKIHDTTFTIIERNINTPIAKKTRINDLQGRCRIVSIADSVSFNHGLPLLHRRTCGLWWRSSSEYCILMMMFLNLLISGMSIKSPYTATGTHCLVSEVICCLTLAGQGMNNYTPSPYPKQARILRN